MLAVGVEQNLEVPVDCVEGAEELSVAVYFRDGVARRPRWISRSKDMSIELSVVHTYAKRVFRLPGHY